MSRTRGDARGFITRGVDVLSVPEFVRGFVGHSVTAELTTHPGHFFVIAASHRAQFYVQSPSRAIYPQSVSLQMHLASADNSMLTIYNYTYRSL